MSINITTTELLFFLLSSPPPLVFGICILMWHSIFFKSVHNLGTNSLYVLLFRISILGQCVIPRQILKTGTEWEIPFQMDEHTFDRHLRITHSQFDYKTYLLKQLSLNEEHTGGPSSIPLRQKLALFLWYLANQNSFLEMSDKFNMSQSSAHRCIVEVLSDFCNMVPSFVSWPTICEKTASSAAFNTKCGIQGIIGAIDGCHIKIQRPHTRGGGLLKQKKTLLCCSARDCG